MKLLYLPQFILMHRRVFYRIHFKVDSWLSEQFLFGSNCLSLFVFVVFFQSNIKFIEQLYCK